MKRFFLIVLIFLSFAASHAAYADTSFLDTPLQLYPAAPKENDLVSLTAVVGNTADYTFAGAVVFYDGDTILGRKEVSVVPGGISTATVKFKIGAGDHKFSARIENPSRVLGSGIVEPLGVSIEQASMSSHVSALPVRALVADATTNTEDVALLKTIDATQEKVLSTLSPQTRSTVEKTATSVDTWRADTAKNALMKREEAKKKIDAASNPKKVTSSKTGQAKTVADGPFAYVAYIFYGLVALVFGSQFVFYVGGVILLVLIVRFVFRRMRRKR
jgi:hypothetical protein